MGYKKQVICPAFLNLYHVKQKSDPELPMIRNYRKHCIRKCIVSHFILNHFGDFCVSWFKLTSMILRFLMSNIISAAALT
jgi:hypothetical protein